MKSPVSIPWLARFCLGAVFFCFWASPLPARAEPAAPSQILFLHLRLTNGAVVLLSSRERPGVLKGTGEHFRKHGLHYQVRGGSGQTIWEGTIEHPGRFDVEYPDAQAPGRLERKRIERQNVDFMIRIPNHPDAAKVDFWELPESPEKESPRPLGTVILKKATGA